MEVSPTTGIRPQPEAPDMPDTAVVNIPRERTRQTRVDGVDFSTMDVAQFRVLTEMQAKKKQEERRAKLEENRALKVARKIGGQAMAYATGSYVKDEHKFNVGPRASSFIGDKYYSAKLRAAQKKQQNKAT